MSEHGNSTSPQMSPETASYLIQSILLPFVSSTRDLMSVFQGELARLTAQVSVLQERVANKSDMLDAVEQQINEHSEKIEELIAALSRVESSIKTMGEVEASRSADRRPPYLLASAIVTAIASVAIAAIQTLA